jgi:saccharopine dehydrogenase-like NADP-dependent oxidoreductase
MIHTIDKDSNTVMFTTETNLKFICQDVHLYGDGTIQYCHGFDILEIFDFSIPNL